MRSFLWVTGSLFSVILLFTLGTELIGKQIHGHSPRSSQLQVSVNPISVRLSFGENKIWPMPISLPVPPFTIDITARFSVESAESSVWGVLLNVYSPQPNALLLSTDRHYFIPGSNFPAYFYDLHMAGQFNQVSLTIDANQQASLILNGQFIWQGAIIFDSSSRQWALFAANSNHRAAVITWLKIVLYQPRS